jgi:hypothetical protein
MGHEASDVGGVWYKLSVKERSLEQQGSKTRRLEEIAEQYSLSEFLHEVARRQETVTVVLEDSDSVIVKAVQELKPLPELEGSIPSGWKDGIY